MNRAVVGLVALAGFVMGGCFIIKSTKLESHGVDGVEPENKTARVIGNGEIASENRSVTSFKSVEGNGAVKIEFKSSDVVSLQVKTDKNLLPYVKTSMRGEVLVIEATGNISTNLGFIITLSGPSPTLLKLSGASEFSAKDFKAEKLSLVSSGASKVSLAGKVSQVDVLATGASTVKAALTGAPTTSFDLSGASNAEFSQPIKLSAIKCSGGSSVKFESVGAKEAQISLQGASQVQGSGQMNKLSIDMTGASIANLSDFEVENLNINASGACQAHLLVTGKLFGLADGGSLVEYSGHPAQATVQSTGASTIVPK